MLNLKFKDYFLGRSKSTVLANNSTISEYRNIISAIRLNHIISTGVYANYLEIGVERGRTFEAIDSKIRVGVDPNPLFNHKRLPDNVSFFKMSSDEFFSSYNGNQFDLIFVDGLHTAYQTYKDVIESFRILSSGGLILLDDVWPSDYASSIGDKPTSDKVKQELGIKHRRWYGDVYKVIPALKYFLPEISIVILGNSTDSHAQALLSKPKNFELDFNRDKVIKFMDSISYSEVFISANLKDPWKEFMSDEYFLSLKNVLK
jgi:hypothetical protein